MNGGHISWFAYGVVGRSLSASYAMHIADSGDTPT